MMLLGLLLGLSLDASAAKARPVPLGERILQTIQAAPDADRVSVNQAGTLVRGVARGRWVYTFEKATTSLVHGHAGPKIIALLSKTELPTTRKKNVQRGAIELWMFEEVKGQIQAVPDWNPMVLGEGYWPKGDSLDVERFGGGDAVAFTCKFSVYDQLAKPRHKRQEGVLLYPLHGQFWEVFRTNLGDRYEGADSVLDYEQKSLWRWKDLDGDGIAEILIARMHKYADSIDEEELGMLRKGTFETYVWNPERAAELDETLKARPQDRDRYRRVPAIPDVSTPTPLPKETMVVWEGHDYHVRDIMVYERRGWYLPRLNAWRKTDDTVGIAVRGGRTPLLAMKYVPGAPIEAIRLAYGATEPHPFTVVKRQYTETYQAVEDGVKMHFRWEGKGVWVSFWVSDDKVLDALPHENVDVDMVEVGIAPELGPKDFGTSVRALVRLNRASKTGGWYRVIPKEESAAFTQRVFNFPAPNYAPTIPDKFPRVNPAHMAAAAWMAPEQWGLAKPTVVPGLSLPQADANAVRDDPSVDAIFELFVPFRNLSWGGMVPEFFRMYCVVVDTDHPGDRPRKLYVCPDTRDRLDVNKPSTWAQLATEF